MRMTKPVAELIAALERSGLAEHAVELRSYIDGGVLINSPKLSDIASRRPLETMRRPFTPREEVEAAVAYLAAYLVAPFRQVEMASKIAGGLGPTDGTGRRISTRRQILLIDERFEDRGPTPAVTDGELAAIAEIEKRLPGMREAMLRQIDDDGGGEPVRPTAPRPSGPIDRGQPGLAAESIGIHWDDATLERLRYELNEAKSEPYGD